MQNSATASGLRIEWGATHRSGDGTVISRQVSVAEPAPLDCTKFSCIVNWVLDMFLYSLIVLYHERRVAYAEKNRNKEILERYRSGEPSPKTWLEVFVALTKLTCPVCRKVETPW